jgi:predicted O-methyltransferase YrrM
MHKVTKGLVLVGLLATHPLEFLDRMEVHWQKRLQRRYQKTAGPATYLKACGMEEGIRALSAVLALDLTATLSEPELQGIQLRVAQSTLGLEKVANLPFPVVFNADPALAQLCYVLCRALEPETVLETGVAYGVTSAMILTALHKNQKGTLHSIDLPPIGDRAGTYTGIVVPNEYKYRWHLHRGSSKRVMASLFGSGLRQIDLFVHDSANVFAVQKRELETVWLHLAPRCAIVMNNIGHNTAFADFIKGNNIGSWLVIEQKAKKGDITGVILRL